LSWERQAYFWQNGRCCLANKFVVPEAITDSHFTCRVNLVCDVESIYINGNYVGGHIPNHFWGNRDSSAAFVIPRSMLQIGGENLVTLFASALAWTGGRSHNLCTLTPSKPDTFSSLTISVPSEDHRFSVDDRNASISLEYKTRHSGFIDLMIVSAFHDTLVHKTVPVAAGAETIPFTFTKEVSRPGFYECIAIMKSDGYSGDVRWFTISPEKVVCSNATPPGFRKYWDESLAELEHVKPEFRVTKIDSLCTTSRDGYIAEMRSLGGLTIRGYYFVPRSSGKHGAILHVPGYGYGFSEGKPFLPFNEDVIEFAICVRGHGISADVFNPGFGVPGVWGYKLCSETENAYRSIYMDCVRAVEFLLSRPEVDPDRICVMGGSQGGGLTLATAGLCAGKIRACAYFDPFPCDTRDQIRIRTLCNTEIRTNLRYYNNPCSFEDALHVQDLIDTKGFADWITCPVLFTTALFDDDCPADGGFAAYNRIRSSKQFKIYPDDSHMGESDNETEMRQFLLHAIGMK
jgi:cephalosporin-C deacetylase-like acetyl esterase